MHQGWPGLLLWAPSLTQNPHPLLSHAGFFLKPTLTSLCLAAPPFWDG